MRVDRFHIRLALVLIFTAIASRSAGAQGGDAAFPKPGRDPKQPIDSAYSAKIREYTTEVFFGSPLVDYLPASRTVPTPMATLGVIAGAPGKLPYSREVHDYMRLLAEKSPRVRVFSIGTSEEGREMIAVAIASDRLIQRYDENLARLAKLGDPRSISMNDAEAEKIMADVAPVYYITGAIHSPEAGSPTALMELAYRLAVDESPYVRNIRDRVVTLITPVVETDGRDRMVDLYNYRKKNPGEPVPGLIWWGKYVAHDNNRDAMAVTLKLTQNVMNTYVQHKAMVLHDLHESVAYLYDNTIGDGPYNAWIDPLLANEWQQIGWHNVQEMTRFGMPGVFAHGTFDTWSPGYLMFIAALHNGVSRLYETFGNSSSADTQLRTLGANDTQRTWYRQNPALPSAMWSLRNNNNYQQTGLLISLAYFANNRRQSLQNFYDRSKRSILKARMEGPAAWVLPSSEPSMGRQGELVRVLQRQHVEISQASEPFTVTVPARTTSGANAPAVAGGGGRAAGAGGGARGGGGGGGGGGAGRGGRGSGPQMESRQFPAGSYIIRMDQPYSRIADALLDYQYWAPNDPQRNPYDDTGWTFPEAFGVEAVRVVDTTVLRVLANRIVGTARAPGGARGTGSLFAVNNNGDNQMATLRYALRNGDFQAVEEPFEAAGQNFNRGTFIIRDVPPALLDSVTKDLGLLAHAIAEAPTVAMHPVRAARVAIMHNWTSTQTEGWFRIAFDGAKVPFDYISAQDIARTADLRSRWDVIIFPPGTGNERVLIDGTNPYGRPIPWKKSPDMPNVSDLAQTDDIREGFGLEGVIKFRDFLRGGGLVIGATSGAQFAMSQGFTTGVTESSPSVRQVDGTLLRTRLLDTTSPITYGMKDNLAVLTSNGANYGGAGGGGGGRRGGGAGAAGGGGGRGGNTRVTGSGRADDVDVVQGRPLTMVQTPPAGRGRAGGQAGSATADSAVVSGRGGGAGTGDSTSVSGRGGGAGTGDSTSAADRAGGGGAGGRASGGGAGAGGRGGGGNTVPTAMRLRPILGFGDQPDLLVSGLLDGGDQIAGRTNIVDAPYGDGHVVLFSFNPMYRGMTIASYALVFNAILHFDNLTAGRRP